MDGQQQNNRYNPPVDNLNSSLEGGALDSHSLDDAIPNNATPGNVAVGVLGSDAQQTVVHAHKIPLLQRRRRLVISIAFVGLALIVAGLVYLLLIHHQTTTQQAKTALPTTLSTTDLSKLQANGINNAQQLDVNGILQVNKGLVLAPTNAPTKPVEGQIYLDSSDHQLYYYDGTAFVSLLPAATTNTGTGVTSLGGSTGDLNLGDGLTTDGLSITNSGVLSLNGFAGGLTLANASSSDGVTLTIDDATATAKGIASFDATNFLVSGGAVTTVQNIGTGATPTFAGVNTNTITPSGSLTVGSTGQTLTLQGNGLTTLSATSGGSSTVLAFQSPTANVTYTFPTAAAGSYTVCTSANPGACGGGGGGGNVNTSGTTSSGTLPLFNGAATITNSIITQSGLLVAIGGNLQITGLGTGVVQSDGSGNLTSGKLNLGDTANSVSGTVGVGSGGTGQTSFTNKGVVFGNGAGGLQVTSAGTAGQVLLANGAGIPTFTSLSGDITIDSAGVTTIGAGKVTNGDLVNSSLSVTAGTGLSGGGSVALGGSTSLSVQYGSVVGTAVQGNITLVCPSGSGNLSGGGDVIALGSGGTCSGISITNSPSFSGTTTTGSLTINNGGVITLNNLTGGASTCLTLDAINHVSTATCATGSGSTPTLQNVYDNSGVAPNILLSSAGKGITIQDNAAPVAGNLLAIKNNAGGITYLGVTSSGTSINGSLSASGTIKFSSLTNGIAVLDGSGNVSSGTINLGGLPSYVSGTLGVGNGGTGTSSFANANGVIYYNGTALTSGIAGTDNQCLLGHTGAAPTFGVCTGAGGVSSVTANNTAQTGALQFNGTANEVSVTNSSTTFTFATPQAIGTASDVQFNSVNATSLLKTNGTTRIDASGNFSAANVAATGTVNLTGLSGIASTTCLVLDGSNNVGTTTCATGSGSSPTLQNVYDNSTTTPNILLSSTGKGITIQDAASTVGGKLLAVKNNAGTITYLGVTTSGASVTGSLSVSSNVTLSSLSGGATAGQCLTTDNSGQLQLVNCLSGGGGSGGVVSVNSLNGTITLDNATTSLQHIVINNAKADGSTKGIASFSSSNFADSAGNITIKTGGVTTTEIANGTIVDADLAGGTYGSITGTGALVAGSIASGFGSIATTSTITGTTVNGTTGINTGAGAGTQRIDLSGNLVNIGTIDTSGLASVKSLTVKAGGTLTLSNLTPGANQCLVLYTSVVSTDNCPTAPSTPTPTLQNVYDASLPANIALTGASGGIVIKDAGTTVGDLLKVTDSTGNKYLDVTATGLLAAGSVQLKGLTTAGAVLTDASGNLSSGAINLASATYVSGTLAVGNGGTGLSTLTANGLLYASSSSAISQVANGTTGQCLVATTGSAPSFGSCGSAGVGTTGTTTDNQIPKFTTGASKLTNSQIADNGTHVSVGGTGTTGGQFNVGTTDQFQVSTTGAVTAVGLNSGTGLIQGSGGLTVSGGNITLSSLSAGSGSCLELDGSNHVVTSTCAAGSGSGNYIQNQNALQQASSNFWISNTGRADVSLLTPALDTAAAGALTIGNNNATSISLGNTVGAITQAINIGTNATASSTSNITIGSTVAGTTIVQNGAGASCFNSAGLAINTQISGVACTGTVGLHVSPDQSGHVAARIQGASGQSKDLLQFESSTGNVLSNFDQNGQLTLGNVSVGSQAGKLSFADGTNNGFKLTLQTATLTANNGVLNIPDLAGATATICTTNSDCTVGAGGTNHYLTQVPSANAANAANSNAISPTANGIVGLTVNGTTGTAATAAIINQTKNATALAINNSGTSAAINISQTTSSPSAAILVNDTVAPSDILLSLQSSSTPNFTVTAAGTVTANGTINTNTFNGNTLTFGSASTTSISSNGANILNIDTGGAAALQLGTANAGSVSVGKGGVTTTVNGALTASQLLSANSGLTIASGSTFTNASSTLHTAMALGDLASGSIGANTTTVDVATQFTINPSAGGRAYTVPNPTNSAAGRIIYISNISANSFTLAGTAVAAGANATLLWNGTAWGASSLSTGVTAVGSFTSASIANGASISGNTITFGGADGTNPGLVNTGLQTFGGAKTFTSLITGQAGLTISGAAVSLNDNSNFNTSINTGTSTGTVSIGSTSNTGNFTLESGTAQTNLFNGNTNHTIMFGAGSSGVQTITIGSTNSSSAVTVQSGTGGINLATNGGVSSTKGTVVQSVTNNSSSAFVVQNASNAAVLNVNTSNSSVQVTAANDTATLGSEMFGAGESFPATGGWASISGTGSSATATHTAGGGTTALSPTPALSVTIGVTYRVAFTVSGSPTAGQTITPSIGGANGNAISGNSTEVQLITATTTGNLAFTPTNNWNGTVASVFVEAVTTTNAAIQVLNSSSTATVEIRSGATNSSTFIGLNAGRSNTTGTNNTSVGISTLQNSTTGGFNTAVGGTALRDNTTGLGNTAIGATALQKNTTGSQNTATGYKTLNSNTTGANNTASGYTSLQNNSSGSGNTATGYSSLNTNTTGSNNTAIGNQSLQTNNTGTGNTAIGYLSDVQSSSLQNATAIGAFALVNQSDSLILGCISGTNSCTTTTKIGIGNTAPAALFSVGSSSQFQVDISGNVSTTGTMLIKSSAATTFQVADNAGTTAVLTADSSNATVTVGSAAGGVLFNNGSTVNGVKALADIAADGPLTTAANINLYTAFTLNQTTGAGARALTLPSPTTNVAASHLIYVSNIGSAAFTIAGVTLSAGTNGSFLWNGSSWSSTAVSTGVTLVGAIDTLGPSANGATISGNTIYLQKATTSNPGLVNTGTQSFAGAKTFTGDVTIADTSATAFAVANNASAKIYFNVDTNSTAGTITLGDTTSGNYITFTAGGGFAANGTARHAKSIVLTPEYAGAILDAASDSGGANCSTNNNGIMTSGYSSGVPTTGNMSNTTQNYYKWSANAAAQCYDVIAQVHLPSDFNAWNNTAGAFFINAYTSDTTNGKIEVQILDSSTSGTAETNYNYVNLTPGSANTWTQKSAATNSLTSANYATGKYFTIRIRMTSPNAGDVRIGNITLNYLSQY